MNKIVNKKVCVKCEIEKLISDFWRQGVNKDGYSTHCKVCDTIRRKAWREENVEKVKKYDKIQNDKKKLAPNFKSERRDYKYLLGYGITLEDYEILLELQDFCCAICSRHESEFKKSLNVDHCHETGKIRGLLCNNCNLALDLFGESSSIVNIAFKYLKDNESKEN